MTSPMTFPFLLNQVRDEPNWIGRELFRQRTCMTHAPLKGQDWSWLWVEADSSLGFGRGRELGLGLIPLFFLYSWAWLLHVFPSSFHVGFLCLKYKITYNISSYSLIGIFGLVLHGLDTRSPIWEYSFSF